MKSITTASKLQSWIPKIVFSFLAFTIYLLFEIYLPGKVEPFSLYCIYRPGAWLALGVTIYLFIAAFPDLKIAARGTVITIGLAAGTVQVLLLMIAGFLYSFGRSPYLFTAGAVLINIFYFLSFAFGIELLRSILIAGINRKYFAEWILVSALFLTFLELPLFNFRFTDGIALLNFFTGRFIPLLAANLLAGVLVYAGGFQAALTYHLVLSTFEWLSPVLPDLPRYAGTGIKTLVPVVFIVVVAVTERNLFPEEEASEASRSVRKWVAAGIVSVLIFWFFSGIFGYKPLVVAGRSMTPALNLGDLVIYQQVPPEEIRIGDIIVFSTPSGTVIHRVVKIDENNGRYYFTTRGGANRVEDHELLLEENIRGRVVFRIPWLGWISIAVRNAVFGVINRF